MNFRRGAPGVLCRCIQKSFEAVERELFAPEAFIVGDAGPVNAAQSFQNRIGKSPFFEALQYGFGFTHDSYGLQTIGGVRYRSVWDRFATVQLYLPSYKIGSQPAASSFFLNAAVQKTRTWYSSGHYVDATQSTAGISRAFGRHFNAFATYSVQQLGDYYGGAAEAQVYPSFVPMAGGVAYPGYAAFRGVATFRTLAIDASYTNGGNFSAWILARRHDDFPRAVPDFFAPPPLDVLGREINGQNYFGQPPYDITADIKLRVNPHMSIDVSRSYYFHFGRRGWSPQFVLQVMQ